MDCKAMIKDTFDYAGKGVVPNGATFPLYYTVFVTLTAHRPNDAADKSHDTVWYAAGSLALSKERGEERLVGDIQMWVNDSNILYLDRSTNGASTLVSDIFPTTNINKLNVSISVNGAVSVQRLVNGRIFMNRPPVTFQATCTDGLLTAVYKGVSYTLSFTLGQSQRR